MSQICSCLAPKELAQFRELGEQRWRQEQNRKRAPQVPPPLLASVDLHLCF